MTEPRSEASRLRTSRTLAEYWRGKVTAESHPVKQARAELLMTQDDLAKLAGVSLDVVGRYEAGHPVSQVSIRRIHAALGGLNA